MIALGKQWVVVGKLQGNSELQESVKKKGKAIPVTGRGGP
jgi:hypothetical protein